MNSARNIKQLSNTSPLMLGTVGLFVNINLIIAFPKWREIFEVNYAKLGVNSAWIVCNIHFFLTIAYVGFSEGSVE